MPRRFALVLSGCLLSFWWSGTGFAQQPPTPTTTQSAIQTLSPGKPVERELKGGEVHTFPLKLAANQYLHLEVEQKGIDVVVTLFGSDGTKLLEVDSPNGTQGPEPVYFVTEQSGDYRLEIKSLEANAPPGKYEAKVVEFRKVTKNDITRMVAQKAFSEGEQLRNQGKKEAYLLAIEKFQQSFISWQTIGDNQGQAQVLNYIGLVYNSLGEKQKAFEAFTQALPLCQTVNNPGLQALTFNNIGSMLVFLGKNQEALNYFEKTLLLYQTVGDKSGEAVTLNNIGSAYSKLGEKQKALKCFTQSLPLYREGRNTTGEISALMSVGSVYHEFGDQQTALEFYAQALSLSQKVPDRSWEAGVLTNIGSAYSALGEKQKALVSFAKALSIFRVLGDRYGEALTLTSIGSVLSVLGEQQKSLEVFTQALAIHQAVLNRNGEAATLNNIGTVYFDLGRTQKALEFHYQALGLHRIVNDLKGEATSLNGIGSVFFSLGEKQKAIEFYSQALLLYQRVGNRQGEANTLNNLGFLDFTMGKNQKALEYLAQALMIQREVEDRNGEAATFINTGLVFDKLGGKQKVLECYQQALLLGGAVENRSRKATALNNLMYTWESLNELRLAIFYGKQSVNLKQELRAAIQGLDKDLQRMFLKTQADTYQKLADLLIAQERFPEALQVLRMLKEDEYFEFVQKDKADASWLSIQIPYSENELSAKTRLDTVLEHFVSLTRESDELNRKEQLGTITETEKTRLVALPDELKQAQSEYESVLEQITKDFDAPVTETSRLNATKELTELQTALKTLNCVAVFTLAAEQNCHTILVTPEQIVAGKTAISRADLTEKVANFRTALTNPGIDPRPIGKELYQILVGPIAKALEETKTDTVMWSLDGTLRYLPPAALWDGKQYLAERFQMSLYTIEPKTLEQIETQSAWTGLGLGVSEAKPGFSKLPGVQAELQGIIRQPGDKPPVGILTGNRLLNQQFTETAFRQQLQKKYPLVHIASHFSFKPGNESQSALLLGDGSLLSLTTIKQSKDLFGGVDLLALSACQTAMGSGENERAGAEIEGFGVLAQRQGARAVLATLWSVADDSTAQLMKQFYRIRQSNPGMSKAEALRQAQLKLLGVAKQVKGSGKRKPNAGVEEVETSSTKSETKLTKFQPDPKAPYSHPYYWAPFILIGNWK